MFVHRSEIECIKTFVSQRQQPEVKCFPFDAFQRPDWQATGNENKRSPPAFYLDHKAVVFFALVHGDARPSSERSGASVK